MKSLKIKQYFSKYFFRIIIFLAVLINIVIAYQRFIVKNNYQVGYEGSCDPVISSCFTGCEDDACTQTYFYTKMEKRATDLLAECGEDITDCDAANSCTLGDTDCSITYCDPNQKMDEGIQCETITEQARPVEFQDPASLNEN